MWLASSTILDEHGSSLDHLDVVVLRQRLLRIDVEEWTHTAQDTFYVLRVCLELILADTFIDLLQLSFRIPRCCLHALLEELFECETIFWVDIRVVV